MLIWINGPFGGGKTVTAFELRRRVENAVVCDPEYVGFGLQRMLPPGMRGDFQDLPAWRSGVVAMLDRVLAAHSGPVIAPMTLVEPAYFDEVVGGLRRHGHDVRHLSLLPSREAVIGRLRLRGLRARRAQTFGLARLDRCLDLLRAPEYATQLPTDGLTVAEVADRVAELCDLAIAPSTDGRVRGFLRRSTTSLRHIRVDLAP